MNDDTDLADVLRVLLPLRFDEVLLEKRTPMYTTSARMDFRLGETIAVVAKRVTQARRDPQLSFEATEDIGYYQRRQGCQDLMLYAYDPDGLIQDPRHVEMLWTAPADQLRVLAVIAN